MGRLQPARALAAQGHNNLTMTVGAVAMLAGMVEVLTSLSLALAPLGKLSLAAAESPLPYVSAAVTITATLILVWFLRERPLVSLPLLLGWPIVAYFALRGHVSELGLAYYGELIAYHFLGFVSAALCVALPLGWATRRDLGRRRLLPLAFALPGSLLLLIAHLSTLPSWPWSELTALHSLGGGLELAVWPLCLALFWPRIVRSRVRWLAPVLLICWCARIGLTGPAALSGASVPGHRILILGAVIVGTSGLLLFAFRPRVPVWLRIVLALVSSYICFKSYHVYVNWFGHLDDAFAGLTRSFFGFALPYPAYVEEVAPWMILGIFFILTTVTSAIASVPDRSIGIALGLLTTAGLGLGSPHLVMMVAAGAFMLIDNGLASPAGAAPGTRAPDDIEPSATRAAGDIGPAMTQVAGSLGFDAPIRIEADGGAVLATEGRYHGHQVALRAREEETAWTISVTVGLPGRHRPDAQLVPHRGGGRGLPPALGKTHKLVGNARALEPLSEATFDALSALGPSDVALWAGGVSLRVSVQDADLDVEAFERVIRGLAEAL